MRKTFKPLFTLTTFILCVIITLGETAFDTSLFGENQSLAAKMAFSLSHPLESFGLNIFLSPFLHLNIQHLIVNTLFFLPLASLIERKQTKFYLAFLMITIHILVLLILLFLFYLNIIPDARFLGLSHIVFGLASYYACKEKSLTALLFIVTAITVGFYQQGITGSLLSHLLGSLVGLILHCLIDLSPKRSNSSL